MLAHLSSKSPLPSCRGIVIVRTPTRPRRLATLPFGARCPISMVTCVQMMCIMETTSLRPMQEQERHLLGEKWLQIRTCNDWRPYLHPALSGDKDSNRHGLLLQKKHLAHPSV